MDFIRGSDCVRENIENSCKGLGEPLDHKTSLMLGEEKKEGTLGKFSWTMMPDNIGD
jgi:hypothetical protein